MPTHNNKTSYIDALRKKAEKAKSAREAKQNSFASSKYNFKPNEGKQTLRILPYPYADEERLPFIEVWFHYGLGKYRSMVCPKETYGEDCPLCNFLDDTRRNAFNKSLSEEERKPYLMSWNSLRPKARVYSPVVVRGDEAAGVKFWGYSKMKVYEEQLETIFLDVENGPILDEYEGRDIKVNYTKSGGKNEYAQTSIMPAMQQSAALPAPAGKKEIEALIASIPNIWDGFLTKKTTEEIQAMVDDLTNGDGILMVGVSSSMNDHEEIQRGSGNTAFEASVTENEEVHATSVPNKPARNTRSKKAELNSDDIESVLSSLDD